MGWSRSAKFVAAGVFALFVASNVAHAICEVRYHRYWPAWVRAGQMWGYPGARFWHGPYGGPHAWYPTGVPPFGMYSEMGFYDKTLPSQMNRTHPDAVDAPEESVPDKQAIPSESLLLNVKVPPTAVVYVNGKRTQLTGAQRTFMTAHVTPGQTYSYEVRAEWKENNRPVTRTEIVAIAAGQRRSVAFDNLPAGVEHVAAGSLVMVDRATLTLHVPAEAKVFVNGQPSNQFGATRVFATTVPADPQKAAHYDVRVEVPRNGQLLVRERTVSLAAGANREVIFDFDEAQLTQSHNTTR
ncbi:MAG TPA: TIGR03000 domain-containing protein [Pirellulales bacterium]|jgi:uncharacterized protein (TIGR03000 family)|nr:TIGR03000 domain-containing protein [Pirellulales bacterium]